MKNGQPISLCGKRDDIIILASRKIHGSMKISDGEEGKNNRENFKIAFIPNSSQAKLIVPKVIHSADIAAVGKNSPEVVEDVDGFITTETKTYISVTYADCPPVALYDRKRKAICIFHSGYEGTLKGISFRAIQMMLDFGADLKNIEAVIGPAICGNCYEYGIEGTEKFQKHMFFIKKSHKKDKILVDIPGIIRYQLSKSGVLSGNISSCGICTYENTDLFSARREKYPLDKIQAGIMVIGMIK